MGQVVQVNGDYNIKTRSGGSITFDTGNQVGNVYVTGTLVVLGSSLSLSTDNLNIKDNIIKLNDGESGPGVTLRYAGLEIDRGSSPSAMFVFDEYDNSWMLGQGQPGAFTFGESKLKLVQIATDPLTNGGDLKLINSGTGVITVAGTNDYELQVTDDDDIPNKKYVDDQIANSAPFQILSDPHVALPNTSSRVIITDKDVAGSTLFYVNATGYSIGNISAVSILVDGVLNSQFRIGATDVQALTITGTTVSSSTTNIKLQTTGTAKLQTNYALQLDNISSTPTTVTNSTIIYGSTPDIGTTGIFYVNNNSTDFRNTAGELINKNKALLFSMIF